MPQRRSWSGWPILAGGATVAAAVAAVVIGLSVVRAPTDVGQDSSPTESPTRSAEPSVAPSPSASPSAAPEPTDTPEATPAPGEFGPVWSMSPEEAFAEPQSCEGSSGEQFADQGEVIRYAIALPGEWYYNPAGSYAFGDIGVERSECRLFGPEAFDPNFGTADNAGATIEMTSGAWTIGGTVVGRTEYTVDGVPAVRFETEPEPNGLIETDPTVTWIVAVGGELGSEKNEGPGVTTYTSSEPFLIISSSSEDPAEFDEFVDVLDRMVATLDVLEP